MTSEAKTFKSFLVVSSHFLAYLIIVWLVFWSLWRAFPQIEPGGLRVYDSKLSTCKSGQIFSKKAKVKLLVVGDSKVISGFKPIVFDTLSGGNVSSYNLGLPRTLFNRKRYNLVELLALLAHNDELPTHLLLTDLEPWPPAADQENENDLFVGTHKPNINLPIERIFPFRRLIRNALAFIKHSRRHGGLREYLEMCKAEIAKMEREKGYYFLESMSIYPSGRLPHNFRARDDNPDIALRRITDTDSPTLKEILTFTDRENITLILTPTYFRKGYCAEPGAEGEEHVKLSQLRIQTVGPAYWLLPNSFFSDRVHLNPRGAETYTRKLWIILEPVLK